MLRRLVRSQGRRWTKIAKSFPDRTKASVYNHWLRIEQGEKDVAEGNFKNHCYACGKPKRVGHQCVLLQVGNKTEVASAVATSAPPAPAPPAPMQHVEAPRPMQPHVPVTADEHHATVGELFGEDVAQTTLDFLF